MRLLDLFCGAGGAAMGYRRAGFDVVGVDIDPQPNYPFELIQMDALDFLDGLPRMTRVGVLPKRYTFDAIHASPPCQHYAPVTRWRGNHEDHPDLFAPTKAKLEAAGVPWVIENVPFAPFEPDVVLCGSQFGLPIRRHRWFLFGQPAFQLMPPCQHRSTDHAFDHGGKTTETEYRAAMGCDWMTVKESRNAIPPAYTEWIGQQLMAHLKAAA